MNAYRARHGTRTRGTYSDIDTRDLHVTLVLSAPLFILNNIVKTSTGESNDGDLDSKKMARTSIPSVNKRLGNLRPSRELLEYYRQKIAEYDEEHERFVHKLEKYKCSYENVHKNHWEIRQREEEIAELQKALSDMQVFLFQEREHVLRLYAENDRLKIKELEDRKRIQHLLSLTCPVNTETTYFIREPPDQVIVHQHCKQSTSQSSSSDKKADCGKGRGPGGYKTMKDTGEGCQDYETLLLTVEALRAQLEEQTRLCKEQVDALLEDRRVRMEEMHALHDRDTERIKGLTDQLNLTQNMLYDSTKDYLDLKYEFRAKERHWMVEKDHLLRQLDYFRENMDVSAGVDPVLGMDISGDSPQKRGALSSKQLQLQLQQSQQLSDNYREQCISMEEELCKLREEREASKGLFKQRTEKLAKRLELMNCRYETLDKRRVLEIEGYKSDIKLLRQRLKEVEKHLYKLTVTLSGDQDMQILSQVKRTASRSKKLMGDLQNIKSTVYSLEKDMRHVNNH